MDNPEDKSTMESKRFFVSPFRLESLAMQELSLLLWRHFVDKYHKSEVLYPSWFIDEKFCSKTVIESPPVMSEMIDKYMFNPMAFLIRDWCEYHKSHIFFDSSLREGVLNCIEEFVSKPDGSISFRLTAKNILTSDKLNLMEKYRLACVNCLADDVESLWPFVRDDPRVMKYDKRENPLIHYWTCIMKGESPRLPGNDPNSFESFVVALKNMEWTAVEYFWEMLTEAELITVAAELLKLESTFEICVIHRLFLKLNERQLRQLLKNIDVGKLIFDPFFSASCNKDTIYATWSYVKHFVSPRNFREILIVILNQDFIKEGEHEISSLLLSIWSSASYQLRSSILSDMNAAEEIFKELEWKCDRFGILTQFDFDMNFFTTVLFGLNFQFRNSLWRKFWLNIILVTPPKCLDRVMKMCFNNDDEISQFKEIHMMNFNEISLFCNTLAKYGHFSKLNEYMEFCSSNIQLVLTLKQTILTPKLLEVTYLSAYEDEGHFEGFRMTNPAIPLSVQLNQYVERNKQRLNFICEKFVDFDKFIDGAFLDDDDAGYYKRKLLMSCKTLQLVYAKSDKTQLGISWVYNHESDLDFQSD